MSHRRTLLRGLAALTTGSVLGFFSSTAAADPKPSVLYNPDHDGSEETIVTARIDPAIRDVIGVPDAGTPMWNDLTARYPSIDAGTFDSVSVNICLEGETVLSGCAIAKGQFDIEAFRRELTNQHARAFGAGSGWSDRFVLPRSPYGIGITETTLAVSYGQTDTEALSYVDTVNKSGYGTHGEHSVAPAALEGDAVSYATLGSRTRSHLLDRIDDSQTDIQTVLRNTEATGVALTVDPTRSRIEYGFVTDPTSVSASDVSAVAGRLLGDNDSLGVESVTRSGRMIVVEAAAESPTVWNVHEQLLGSVSR